MSACVDIILGIQWGDEGKGRVIDRAADEYDVVARFGGGDNAGHTIVIGNQRYALRVVPSGVFHQRPRLFIGGGTVISLEGLLAEFDMLAKHGVDLRRIAISDRAHIVFPYHAALDRAADRARGENAIGTTGRGIGPAYVDKVARTGITFGDLRNPDMLEAKLRRNHSIKVADLARLDLEAVAAFPTFEQLLATTKTFAERIVPHIVDGVSYIHEAFEGGQRILVEGAQGTLLDIGYGTYPFVTSSHTIAGGACIGLGIGPTQISRVTGIAKAYCTRVGAGPFPSELHDEFGLRLRERGAEFGVVTKRPRRCGWFDAVAARYAARVNGLTDAVITKLDVISGFERIGIVTEYRLGGSSVGVEAMGEPDLKPVVTWHQGWNDDLSEVRRIDDLPALPRAYVAELERCIGVPISAVSVGPERASLATV
ncbi:MAG TPA: adenylosuccinate synthase [Candidatus Baltobacteraceae bacterium]|jgi:adenylosuccinate synthase|nr:adenylosuccinate synthase [Candidatus Baltobacteraceae bacterium]